MDLFLLKNGKKGGYSTVGTGGSRGMAWDPRGCGMARKATWQSHASPCGRLRGVDMTWTRSGATRVHTDAWVAPRGKRSD